MVDKMMDRVAKLLATAGNESATPAERELAMERANVLAQAHSIDLALARSHNAKKERPQAPERRSHRVAEHGRVKGRNNSGNNAPFVDLFLAICHAYDLRCTISGDNTMVHAIGFPEDHEIAERMFSILSVQMVTEADTALKAGANKTTVRDVKRKRVPLDEEDRNWGGFDSKGQQYDLEPGVPAENQRYWQGHSVDMENREHPPPSFTLEDVYDDQGNPVYVDKQVTVTDARVWRKNYYTGFSAKIEQRLRAEKRQAMREAGIDLATDQTGKGLAIIEKQEQVEEAYKEEQERYVLANNGRALGSYSGTKASASDYSAQAKGARDAELARTGNERDLDGV